MNNECMPGESIIDINLGMRMIRTEGGFTYGTDALLLAAFARGKSGGRCADLGCGAGSISLLLAGAGKYEHVTAVEAQPEYAALARRNAALNSLDDRIAVIEADIRELPGSLRFDAVLTNPPYMKVSSGKAAADSGRNRSRHETRGGIDEFCTAAARMLEWGSPFYIVYRPDRLCDLISAMRSSGIEPKRMCFVQCDELHEPSLVLVEGIRGGSAALRLLPTLMLRDRDENDSKRYREIIGSMSFDG